MKTHRRIRSIVLAVLLAPLVFSLPLRAATFDLSTATVADINAAFDAGALTAEKLVGLYLKRIEAYDKQGPKVNCVITINPQALDQARALDAERKAKGPRSPLHGIPIVLKDLIDVAGMPTTAGFTPFGAPIAPRDATIVARMHAAGALILAKVSTTNWFGNGFGDTHPIGVSPNPYNLSLSPGGSSNGSGVAMACYFATLAVGTDTSVSVQSPSSNCSVVGMVGTYGMVSRAGIVPRGATQDRPGPMGRSVYDVATLYSVMSGWDAEDLTTFNPIGHFPQTDWAQELKQRDVKGKRIGVLREMLPVGEQYAEGLALFERALEDLKKAGAFIIDPILTGSPNISIDTAQGRGRTAEYEKIAYTDAYLARLGANGKFKNTREMMEKVGADKFSGGMATALALGAPGADPEYLARYKSRQAYIALISETYDKYSLDAFVLPFTVAPAPELEGTGSGRSGRTEGNRTASGARVERHGVNNITSTLGLPAVVVPAGYTPSKNFPIATQFFGKPFTDLKVLQIAYGYEQTTKRRKTPETTPPLPGEIFDYKSPTEKATVASTRE